MMHLRFNTVPQEKGDTVKEKDALIEKLKEWLSEAPETYISNADYEEVVALVMDSEIPCSDMTTFDGRKGIYFLPDVAGVWILARKSMSKDYKIGVVDKGGVLALMGIHHIVADDVKESQEKKKQEEEKLAEIFELDSIFDSTDGEKETEPSNDPELDENPKA